MLKVRAHAFETNSSSDSVLYDSEQIKYRQVMYIKFKPYTELAKNCLDTYMDLYTSKYSGIWASILDGFAYWEYPNEVLFDTAEWDSELNIFSVDIGINITVKKDYDTGKIVDYIAMRHIPYIDEDFPDESKCFDKILKNMISWSASKILAENLSDKTNTINLNHAVFESGMAQNQIVKIYGDYIEPEEFKNCKRI